jgi:hypothetical protein
MKKVITVFDDSNFSETAINFIKQYPSEKKPLLVGVFLSAVDYSNEFGYSISMAGTISPVIEDPEIVASNIARFKDLCKNNHIEHEVHNDVGEEALERLRKETSFADLLIISSELFFKTLGEKQPGPHMKNILQNAECPILLLPEQFNFPKRTILAYDGSNTSTYAIRQFSYIFPELRKNTAMLAFASDTEDEIPQQDLVEELCTRHFNDLSMKRLDFSPKTYFSTWLTDQKDAIVVTGGYSQKGISLIFHKNFMSEVIAEHRIPVFIAHK